MIRNPWEEVSEILADCLELKTDERQHHLDSLNLAPDLRSEIESLLSYEQGTENLMNLSAVELAAGYFDEKSVESAVEGQTFGVYRVVREIGYGGMGAVYLAERSDGKFEQKVALKLLKREMNTEPLRRRFQQEREILASLDHPNIARLLDAGATDDNIPYLAMEYVDGISISDFCNRNDNDLNQRLDLFREVCLAVDFAHRNLVVHRDLKPSNILVTSEGVPKLLDFGISKFVSAEVGGVDPATITNLGVMTPSYASPEQLQNKSVSTATDIYSLGVILYEMLSGHRPFETKEGDLKEAFDAVIEIDPPPPSSMIEADSNTIGRTGQANAAIKPANASVIEPRVGRPEVDTGANSQRHTSAQHIGVSAHSIRGDLDNIVLKALRKESERRYLSAEKFAADIHRHQRGLPVAARPNTLSYRAEKFFKRNKASAVAAILILIAVIAGMIATLWQARVANAERVKAERRFNDVRELANSFLFKLGPKIETLPGSTEARRELVTLALEYLDRLSQEAGDDPELQRELAAAYEMVGRVQGDPLSPNLGDFEGAAKSFEKAFEIRKTLFDNDPTNLTAMSDMASSYGNISNILIQLGTTEKVDEFFQRSLALRKEVVHRDPGSFDARKDLAVALRGQGLLNYTNAKYKDAVINYNEARSIYEQLLKEQPENVEIAENQAFLFIDIGVSVGWDDDLRTAEESLQRGLDLLIALARQYPNNQKLQRSLMQAYNHRGSSTIETGDHGKAVYEYAKSVEIAKRISEADPLNFRAKWDVVTMERNYADALSMAGRNKEALQTLDSTLETAVELSKKDPNNTRNLYEIATIQLKTAESHLKSKEYERALGIFQQARENYQAAVDNDAKYRFAVRTVYLTTLSIADAYAAFAERHRDKALYLKALENYQSASVGFNKMKSEGKLGEYDDRLFTEIAAGIKMVENKLAN